MNWNYTQPVEIIFGSGSLSKLPSLTEKFNRPVVVTEKYFIENGLIEKIVSQINADVFTDAEESGAGLSEADPIDDKNELLYEEGLKCIGVLP